MQHDEVIWQIINHEFCSFKSKVAKERTFCQNPYNVTGLCIRSACPLANSKYATIREEEGICYLYMKTIERAHTPKKLWEKIRLPSNYMQALEMVSNHLEHFPIYLVHRNKQRLTKIHQMLIRMRKLKLKARPKLVTINTNNEKMEKIKEKKALKTARLEKAIENELLERLKQVSDGEIYNYPEVNYNKVLNQASKNYQKEAKKVSPSSEITDFADDTEEGEIEYEQEEREEEEEEEEEESYDIEYVEDFEESDDEEEQDDEKILERYEHLQELKQKRKSNDDKSNNKKNTKKGRIEIEYEDDEIREKITDTNLEFNF